MYLDGFVLPLPQTNLTAYREMATKGNTIWMEHGALAYRECLLDPTDSPGDFGTTFSRMAGAAENETIVFAYILYRDRAHRDQVMADVMADPRMAGTPESMPFDEKRMAYGGFTTIVASGNL